MTKEMFGPLLENDGVRFRLWAPAAKTVELVIDNPVLMDRDGEWFTQRVHDARGGTRYAFRIDGDVTIPDPASRFQPDDVHGVSEVVDQAYRWNTPEWKGRPWSETVLYELHVGTFTPDGTYRAVVDKLDHLVRTGITAIELMPLADFPGRWNWGYDGVLLFAPDSAYGTPNDLKFLIDAAHARGLMVFLDVVYNHFGPDGNYIGRIAPGFFSEAQTPWGGAIDYTRPEVRSFVIENAVYWLRDYRFDGLRLDAVHALVQAGTPHLLHDLSAAVGKLAEKTGRQIHLVLENDDNRAGLLAPFENPPNGHYRAQWNDDYHHAWHVLLTGEQRGYYKDYVEAGRHVARSLADGFVYQGEVSPHRAGQSRGEPSMDLSPLAFVNFIQNHDQIGNRAKGERLTSQISAQAIDAALSILLLSPSPPLLFMGEEWGATEPFPFFCDFKGDLADAVRKGRKSEFAEAYADFSDDIPDPLEQSTVRMATLDWSALAKPAHAARLTLVRELLHVRKLSIIPLAADLIGARSSAHFEQPILRARWSSVDKTLMLLANLSDKTASAPKIDRWGAPIWGGVPSSNLPPWSVFAAIGVP